MSAAIGAGELQVEEQRPKGSPEDSARAVGRRRATPYLLLLPGMAWLDAESINARSSRQVTPPDHDEDDFDGAMLSHRRGSRFESLELGFFGYQPRRR